jgi:drug/metabolite transporter (DMT)-like permease
MISLSLSILASCIIFILFKFFPKFGIDTFQAIVFNYVTACCCGFLLYGSSWRTNFLTQTSWMPFAFGAGVLFISLFLLMGRSTQVNGVASTSVASKMSMVVSAIAMIFLFQEAYNGTKILGFILAVCSVVLVTYSPNNIDKDKENNQSSVMLIALFLGSGLLDILLTYNQHVNPNPPASLFSAIGFGLAGCIGIIILIGNLYFKKNAFEFKNVLAGICLGIPNYFSIYLLLNAYRTSGLSASSVLTCINVGVVCLSGILGLFLFKEVATRKKVLGLACAIASILIIYISSL